MATCEDVQRACLVCLLIFEPLHGLARVLWSWHPCASRPPPWSWPAGHADRNGRHAPLFQLHVSGWLPGLGGVDGVRLLRGEKRSLLV